MSMLCLTYLTILSDNEDGVLSLLTLDGGTLMYLFAYGLVSVSSKENQMYIRIMRMVAEKAWVLNGALYLTALDFPVLTYGENKIKGKLFFADEDAMLLLKGLAETIDKLNLPYTYLLNPIKAYTDHGVYDAYAFMYNSSEGLAKLNSDSWMKSQ
jgi:gamma-glutamylcyclotransferase (GGCT)/AIG2-like uncharacterized protein YtfP